MVVLCSSVRTSDIERRSRGSLYCGLKGLDSLNYKTWRGLKRGQEELLWVGQVNNKSMSNIAAWLGIWCLINGIEVVCRICKNTFDR